MCNACWFPGCVEQKKCSAVPTNSPDLIPVNQDELDRIRMQYGYVWVNKLNQPIKRTGITWFYYRVAFLKWDNYPQNNGFQYQNGLIWMIWGCPHFRKPPYTHSKSFHSPKFLLFTSTLRRQGGRLCHHLCAIDGWYNQLQIVGEQTITILAVFTHLRNVRIHYL